MISFSFFALLVLLFITIIMFLRTKDVITATQIIFPINSLIILLITLYCYKINKPEYIDIALLYAVVSYVSIFAIKKYFAMIVKEHQDKENVTNN